MQEEGEFILLDVQIRRADIILHTADGLTAENIPAKETQCRIGEVFASGGAFSAVRLFHQDVEVFR